MERLYRRYKRRAKDDPRPEDEWKAPLASALQQVQLIYLAGALFVGIAFQPFVLMLIGVQCGLWSYLNRVDSPVKAPRKSRIGAGGKRLAPGAVTAKAPALR